MTAPIPTGAYALTTRLRNASAEPLRVWVASHRRRVEYVAADTIRAMNRTDEVADTRTPVMFLPALMERVHTAVPSLRLALDTAPRDHNQHRYTARLDAEQVAALLDYLRGALPGWRESFIRGSPGEDGRAGGRAVARRLVEQAEGVFTALGEPLPVAGGSVKVTVTPIMLDALRLASIPHPTAREHKPTKRWEIVFAGPAEREAFGQAILALLPQYEEQRKSAPDPVLRSKAARIAAQIRDLSL